MSTNYFHRTAICGECGRYDRVHIGKNLVMFEGRFGWDDEGQAVPEVTSWRQWRDRLRAGGEVWDENGVLFDTEEFIALVEATDAESRRRQFDWVADPSTNRYLDPGRAGVVGPRCDWLDADGFTFYGGEFS